MATSAPTTGLNQLGSVAQLMALLGGGGSSTSTTTTSGGKSTTQTELSEEAMQRLLQQILEGAGGTRSIAGAARGAGLYNSSTEQQLLNDLWARAAGEVAARSAPTVTTTTPQTQTTRTKQSGGVSLGGTLGGLLALGAGNALFNSDLFSGVGDTIANFLGFGSDTINGSNVALSGPAFNGAPGFTGKRIQDTDFDLVNPGQLSAIGGDINAGLNFLNAQGSFLGGLSSQPGFAQNYVVSTPAFSNFAGGLPSFTGFGAGSLGPVISPSFNYGGSALGNFSSFAAGGFLPAPGF